MSFIDNDTQLLTAVNGGNMRKAKAALQAGANVDGSPVLPCAPIVAATLADHVGMVEVLLERGADPDKPVTAKVSGASSDMVIEIPGERALHIAARSGYIEIVRLLLKWPGADPNATDNTGCTPLVTTCNCQHACVEVVQLLLEAGADASLADENGWSPLHAVATKGHMDLVDMLYSRAPDTLNRCTTTNAATPLFMACSEGNESMVSKLVSLGAMQSMPPDDSLCPLAIAVGKGFVDVVRVLVKEGGIRAIGGEAALVQALYRATNFGPPRILRLLLMVDGEEGRSKWANIKLNGRSLLYYGAGICCPAVVSVLLEAGADEAARDSGGLTPLDIIGLTLGIDDGVQIDRRKHVAIYRMLQRCPAYRARSWAWPSDGQADAGGSGDGDTAAAAVLSFPPSVKTSLISGVRIFRSKEDRSGKVFVRLVGRYCAKD